VTESVLVGVQEDPLIVIVSGATVRLQGEDVLTNRLVELKVSWIRCRSHFSCIEAVRSRKSRVDLDSSLLSLRDIRASFLTLWVDLQKDDSDQGDCYLGRAYR
jgi:hypothetical protein